jgi:MerR family transcriptional regulator, light-induced transcriptional regulator
MNAPTERTQAAVGAYPMRLACRMTGLSAHAIRVWERRYHAVTPARTAGNGRRYSDNEVRRLALLHRLTRAGHSIKDIAGQTDAQLAALFSASVPDTSLPAQVAPLGAVGTETATRVCQQYLDAVRRFDSSTSADLLTRAALTLDRAAFVYDIALPIVRAAGDLWEAGRFTVAHEHLVTAQLRGLLDALLRQEQVHGALRRILVATPEGHRHEFGALIGALLLASHGYEPLYLGADVPFVDCAQAASAATVTAVVLSVLRDVDTEELSRLRAGLALLASASPVWLGVPAGHALCSPQEGVRVFNCFEDFERALVGNPAA